MCASCSIVRASRCSARVACWPEPTLTNKIAGSDTPIPALKKSAATKLGDRRTPVLSPAYDFVAPLPYIPGDTLALNFGGSRSLAEITPDQMRNFADTARIPASPLWQIAVETAERTVAAWKTLEQADLLPKEMRASIEKQILAVAATLR